MKKIVTLIPLLSLTLMVGAQNFQTEVALVEVPNFNGKTLAKAPAGKSKTLQLVRTKYSRSMDSYTERRSLRSNWVTSSDIQHLGGMTLISRCLRVFLRYMTKSGR